MAEKKEEKKDLLKYTEEAEEHNGEYTKTGYPVPDRNHKIVYEAFSLSMEETYFWILGQLTYDFSYTKIDKITDIFSASENSSFFGQASQRLGIQQDKVTTVLATTGKMSKDLFALVRELRIIDERLAIYGKFDKEEGKWKFNTSKAADVTLKEVFVNLVENQGGQSKPSSVYGLAQQIGYVTLPDFFFNVQVNDLAKIDGEVNRIQTNVSVKNVLRRKLYEFLVWKEQTFKELQHRRKFLLHYLRQHWAVIKMYMGWLKPYLRNIKRLSMNEKQILSPDIISAFETAALEIEVLAHQNKEDPQKCLLITFKYFVKPSLSYQQPESYQRGAVHVGRVDMTFRSYGWTLAEINEYKAYRQKEELELLSIIDESLKASMDALAGDLEKYLAEAGEEEFKKKQEEEEEKKIDKRTAFQKFFNIEMNIQANKNADILEPFKAVFMGAGEISGAIFSPLFPSKWTSTSKGPDSKAAADKAKDASGNMLALMKNYKKSHQLLSW